MAARFPAVPMNSSMKQPVNTVSVTAPTWQDAVALPTLAWTGLGTGLSLLWLASLPQHIQQPSGRLDSRNDTLD